jgi:hypothetical protein
MIKKTFTFENFAGDKVTKDYYFHLSKADFVELGFSGWQERMQAAVNTKDQLGVFHGFKWLISQAVGVRSEDGEDFTKPADFRDKFMNSPAFDELIMELFTSDDMGTSFIRGCLPGNMQVDMDKEMAKLTSTGGVNPFEEKPAWIRENREPTNLEMDTITREQLLELHKRKIEQLTERKNELDNQ